MTVMPRDVDAAGAYKDLIEIDFVQEIDCGLADQRERASPLHDPTGNEGLQAFAVAQLHGDIDGIGDDANIVAVPQIPRHLRGGSAGCVDGKRQGARVSTLRRRPGEGKKPALRSHEWIREFLAISAEIVTPASSVSPFRFHPHFIP
jgi:hypothetical protein